jgi:hypothetical protein
MGLLTTAFTVQFGNLNRITLAKAAVLDRTFLPVICAETLKLLVCYDILINLACIFFYQASKSRMRGGILPLPHMSS